MSGIRDLLEGLEDSYPLRLRRREARDAAARRLKAAARARAIRSLRRGPVENPALENEVVAGGEALREVERACAALDGRWEALDRAVAAAEAARGVEPPAPVPAILGELDLLSTGGAALRDGFAPRGAAPPPESPGLLSGRTAIAVGAGIAMVALGAPHFAFHAALAARHAGEGKTEIRRPASGGAASQAMERLREGIPRGEPSADGVRDALDALAGRPRDAGSWEAFLEAAQERVEVLRRTHLRARAAALLERQEP